MTWRERSDWTRTSEAKIFRAREEVKNRYPAEGVSPRGYWFTVGSRFGENVPSGLEPDGTRRERPSAHVGWSGYWFEPEERI